MSKNTLVLGGTKYFGKHLVRLLLDRGDNVYIASRGNNPIPKGCNFIKFNRDSDIYQNKIDFDIVYDQSCYRTSQLFSIREVIMNCGLYIFTSSQSVYPFKGNLKESEAKVYQGITDYGLEKLKSEAYVSELTNRVTIPRLPVVIGKNDYHKRVQKLKSYIYCGEVLIPSENPLLNIIYELDAAKALFKLSEINAIGPINIASPLKVSTKDICLHIASKININCKLKLDDNFNPDFYSLFKSKTKTLSCEKQKAIGLTFFVHPMDAIDKSI